MHLSPKKTLNNSRSTTPRSTDDLIKDHQWPPFGIKTKSVKKIPKSKVSAVTTEKTFPTTTDTSTILNKISIHDVRKYIHLLRVEKIVFTLFYFTRSHR